MKSLFKTPDNDPQKVEVNEELFDFKAAGDQNLEGSDDNDKNILIKNLLSYHETLHSLKEAWKFSILGAIPTKKMKNYFGEKITMYYKCL